MHHRHLPLALLLTLPLMFLTACSSFWFSTETTQEPGASEPSDEKIEEPAPPLADKVKVEDKTEALPKPEPEPESTTRPADKKADKVPSVAEPPGQSTPPTTSVPTITAPVKTSPEVKTAVETTAPVRALATGTLQGKIQIIGKKNKSHRPSNVIITLSAQSGKLPQTSTPVTHDINMKKKTYTPVVQTIHKGDSLQFNNRDNIKHNVFSSSGDNTFDLGTFEGGGERAVQMNHSGIVKVYCNIHPEMATFVMVTDNSFSAITDNSGEFVIEDIPPGDYVLKLWHIRGELEQKISVTADNNPFLDLTINASNYKRIAHKNKFGEDYKKKPALFEDEFY